MRRTIDGYRRNEPRRLKKMRRRLRTAIRLGRGVVAIRSGRVGQLAFAAPTKAAPR